VQSSGVDVSPVEQQAPELQQRGGVRRRIVRQIDIHEVARRLVSYRFPGLRLLA
jgi:hypothetical protein